MGTVTFSPTTAIMNNKPAGTIVIGRPGSGKTYFLLNIAANAMMTSSDVIFIDFKNDSLALKNINPNIRIIDINKIKPGAMDPFKVLKNVDVNTLMSVIKSLSGSLTEAQVNSVSPIVKDFVNKNRRDVSGADFLSLANYLYSSDNEDAQTVGTILKNHEDSEYGGVIFGSADPEDTVEITDSSQIISLFGMSIPGRDARRWNEEDKFTSTIIYIIYRILSEVLTKKNKKPIVIIIDESHIMYGNYELSSLVDKLLVLGRSLNIAIVLASQNITHYPDDIDQLIATKFMFGSSADQAREFLERFDPSVDDGTGQALDRNSIINFISDASRGLCFMIDSENRSGYVQIRSNLGVTSNPLNRK